VCPVPDEHGEYALKFDLVAEGLTWFELTGSEVAVTALTVGVRSGF
jgi:hypothetical protein